MKKQSKPLTAAAFEKLPLSEREANWEDLEAVSIETKGKPLTAAQRRLHARGRRKAGRPRIGQGSEKIRISVERQLLHATDRLAEKQDVTRSQLIASALKLLLRRAA